MKFAIVAAILSTSALAAPAAPLGGLLASAEELLASVPLTADPVNFTSVQEAAFSKLTAQLEEYCTTHQIAKNTNKDTLCFKNLRGLADLPDEDKISLLAAAVENEQGVLKALAASLLTPLQQSEFKSLAAIYAQMCASQLTQNTFCYDNLHKLEKLSDQSKISLLNSVVQNAEPEAKLAAVAKALA